MFKKALPVFIIFIFLLCGCAEVTSTSAGKIIPPTNQPPPLIGSWRIVEELGTGGETGKTMPPWSGSEIQFAENAIALNGYVWDHPSYKIKRVKADNYFAARYLAPSGITPPAGKIVDVVTVYTDSNFLGELIRLGDTGMIFFIQERGLLLEKISDDTDDILNRKGVSPNSLGDTIDEGSSGILLGLRILSQNEYTYQTLWVAADKREQRPVLFANRIFFPRMGGFWELEVSDIYTDGRMGNILTANNVAPKPQKGGEELTQQGLTYTEPSVKIVNYVGNDYIAIEKNSSGESKLQVLPIDKLSAPRAIKVSDLLGDEGLNAYISAREVAIKSLGHRGITSVDKDDSGENFSLARENGHWYFMGRVNYQNGETKGKKDFKLKILPPESLIFYDALKLNWNKIKDRVPDAMDAFTSPQKDIILVKTKNKLRVYAIETEQLSKTPLTEINLGEGTEIIMAEWATGMYVDSWEKAFLSYGAHILP